MKYLIYIFIIAVIIAISIVIIALIIKKNKKEEENVLKYRKKYLLTKNEYSFLQKLKSVAKENNLNILCKIRLADLIEPLPNKNKSEWYTEFNKIKSKHIDFVLVTENMKVVMLIELEDSSHSKSDRIERDNFINSTLKQVGYNLICVYNNSEAVNIIESALINKEESHSPTGMA